MTSQISESPSRTMKGRDRDLIASLFALDSLSLAVVRVGLAILLVYDSWAGLLAPGGALAGSGGGPWSLLRLLLVPAVLMLLVGWKVRLATISCWLIYAYAIRTSLFTPGAPVPFESYVLTLVLFWGMFLPFGASASIDSRSQARRPTRFLSVASAGLMIQVFLIYFSAGMTKNFDEWIVHPTALLDILSNPRHGNALGEMLTRFPTLLGILSVVTIAVEIIGPLLLFVPGPRLALRRTALVGVFVGFHIALALLMDLGTFPLVMMVVWCAFLPPEFWRRWSPAHPPMETLTDTNRWRNLIAGTALVLVVTSNVVTWVAFPAESGLPAIIQEVARNLALYQQWTMYSVPSTL